MKQRKVILHQVIDNYVKSFQLYCKTSATILCNHIRSMKGFRTVQDHTPVQPNHYKTQYYVIAMIYWL